MSKTQSRLRVSSVLCLGLLIALGLVAGCGGSKKASPTATPQVATATKTPQATVPSPVPTPSAAPATVSGANLPVGVDAEGHFYRGDPNAPVKLLEFSDFQ